MLSPSLGLAIILLVVAIVIFALELFVPSAGLLFVLGSTSVVLSLVVAFLVSAKTGIAFLIIVAILTMILPALGIEIWKRSWMGKRMFLSAPGAPADANAQTEFPDYDSSTQSNSSTSQYAALIGAIGKTLTPLRPAGITDFSGRRFDTVAEGVMIGAGEYVKVVVVQGNRIVVRQMSLEEVPQPEDVKHMNAMLEEFSIDNEAK
jgi:membrane-bound serine protease (ClpP class)